MYPTRHECVKVDYLSLMKSIRHYPAICTLPKQWDRIPLKTQPRSWDVAQSWLARSAVLRYSCVSDLLHPPFDNFEGFWGELKTNSVIQSILCWWHTKQKPRCLLTDEQPLSRAFSWPCQQHTVPRPPQAAPPLLISCQNHMWAWQLC